MRVLVEDARVATDKKNSYGLSYCIHSFSFRRLRFVLQKSVSYSEASEFRNQKTISSTEQKMGGHYVPPFNIYNSQMYTVLPRILHKRFMGYVYTHCRSVFALVHELLDY